MKNVNELVNIYTELLKEGELQIAYRSILGFVNKLRIKIMNEHPEYAVGTTYLGQMDITFFSVSTKLLQENGLKILVLYEHEENTFNLWLSSRNRNIAKNLETIFRSLKDHYNISKDENNKDSILEYRIIQTPDFDRQEDMMLMILSHLITFISMIEQQLRVKVGDA